MSLSSSMRARGVQLFDRARDKRRRSIAFVVYGLTTTLAFASAFLVRFEFEWPVEYWGAFLFGLPLLLLIRHAAHLLFRLTTSRWRFVGVQDVVRLVGAAGVGSIVFLLVTRALPVDPTVPMSVVALEGILSVVYTAGVWICYRVAFEAARNRRGANGMKGGRRVVIIGAGESGYMLAREMLRGITAYRPLAFVDDDPYKWGTRLAGLEVVGSTDDLPQIVSTYRPHELILAVPHATPTEMRVLVEKCADSGLPYRALPSIAAVLAGNVSVDQIREVRIEDLLGREPVQLNLVELAQDLAGGCALVTGAAGSIGSELSRQIARHNPDVLLLLDQAETELFYLEMELRDQHPDLRIIPLVRDVVEPAAIEAVFGAYSPSHVFHAAAYKHVPMMETNAREALRNNVMGSYVMAETAGRHGTGKFVLVSTDKAVTPRSVMGASKRLAEIVTLELQDRYPDTAFAAVRFGNVLGSNGSVIPIFRRQLAAGQPLTVTHPDATRYFMTIPEAVQLILQASLLPEIRGHIAMLEMGEPVRIVDLAENLLRLSGIQDPQRIVFTGLRAGEKLHEELVAPEEETVETAIQKVRLVMTGNVPPKRVLPHLDAWERALAGGYDAEISAALDEFFPERRTSDGQASHPGYEGNGRHAAKGGDRVASSDGVPRKTDLAKDKGTEDSVPAYTNAVRGIG